jgi:hypothetical protein
MNLKLALVVAPGQTDCTIRWLDQDTLITARYSAAVQDRIKIRPSQLVAVDTEAATPTVMWRWFRGRVEYRQEDYVVVNNRLYQPSHHHPISVVRLPDVVAEDVQVGDEVFYTTNDDGAVADTIEEGHPAHPERIGADLFPAIAAVYAEMDGAGGS